MTDRMTRWLEQAGFKWNGTWRWDYGSLRVARLGESIAVIMFTGEPGESPAAWHVEFSCPDGRLAAPESVVLAAIKQAWRLHAAEVTA